MQIFTLPLTDDYRNFTGNIGKLGLGLVSISFDILFILQHYVFYRHREEPILQSVSNNDVNGNSKQTALQQKIKDGLSIDNLNNNISSVKVSNGIQNQAFNNDNN